jgi:SLT domain-containing protein
MWGVLGTILGTILGWVLNNMSRIGKVKVWVNEMELFNSKTDGYGGRTKVVFGGKDVEVSIVNGIYIELDFYNESQLERRIVREAIVIYREKEYVAYKNHESLKLTFTINSGEVKSIKETFHNSKNGAEYKKGEKVILKYKDHKNKLITKELKRNE